MRSQDNRCAHNCVSGYVQRSVDRNFAAQGLPTRNALQRLSQPRTRALVDPALASRPFGADAAALIAGRAATTPVLCDGMRLGQLFEALFTINENLDLVGTPNQALP